MSDIFISYTHEDQPYARTLAQSLEAQGWSVWWDRTIPAGKIYDEVIEEALAVAKCIIVLWSERSVKSEWVRTEAQEGVDRRILIPVLIENEDVRIPLTFRRIQSANLIGWNGEVAAPSFKKLVNDIAALLGSTRQGKENRKSFPTPVKPRPAAARKRQAASGTAEAGFREQFWDKMVEIISERLGVNALEVTKNSNFVEDLGADSLDLVELVMAFEEQYHLDIPDEEAEKLITVGDAYRYAISRLGL